MCDLIVNRCFVPRCYGKSPLPALTQLSASTKIYLYENSEIMLYGMIIYLPALCDISKYLQLASS